jgi:hypothetical protein
MPLIDEIQNTLLFIAEMPEEAQKDIAQDLSRRVVAYDYARTMKLEEVYKLTELALLDLTRTIDQLKR